MFHDALYITLSYSGIFMAIKKDFNDPLISVVNH